MSNWSQKTDKNLVEILRGDDPNDISQAIEELKNRYERELKNWARKTLGGHRAIEVDDIVQETFIGLWQSAKGSEIKNVKSYLKRITHNKSVDALEKHTREEQIEKDLAVAELMKMGGVEDRVMRELETKEQLQFALQLPFNANLSPCQRVIWMLEQVYEYPPRVVARLMGKKRNTIDTQFSMANKQIMKSISSETDSLEASRPNTLMNPSYEVLTNAKFFVERFSDPIIPTLTPEELRPLGLTMDELQKNYVASLIFPELNAQKWSLERRPLVLALSKRQARKRWENKLKIVAQCIKHNEAFLATKNTRGKSRAQNLFTVSEYLSCFDNPHKKKKYQVNLASNPEEYLISVQIDGENMILQSLMEYPLFEPYEKMIADAYLPVEVHHSMGLFRTGVTCRPDLHTGALEHLMGLEEGFLDFVANAEFVGQTWNIGSIVDEWLASMSTC